MPLWLRGILVVVLGWIVGSMVMMALHFLSLLVYPLPEGTDWMNPESMKTAMAAMPTGAWLAASLAHMVGAFAGAWLAASLAGRAPLIHALIIGAIFLAGGIMNLSNLQPPESMQWIWVVDLAIVPVAAVFGGLLARKKK